MKAQDRYLPSPPRPGASYPDSRVNRGGPRSGFLPYALQLHPRDVVEADAEPRRSPRCSACVHRTGGDDLHGFWYGFGKYDGYAIFEAPDNASVAGAVLAITAGGALASVETTVLMTVEETLEALAKGKGIGYRRPGE